MLSHVPFAVHPAEVAAIARLRARDRAGRGRRCPRARRRAWRPARRSGCRAENAELAVTLAIRADRPRQDLPRRRRSRDRLLGALARALEEGVLRGGDGPVGRREVDAAPPARRASTARTRDASRSSGRSLEDMSAARARALPQRERSASSSSSTTCCRSSRPRRTSRFRTGSPACPSARRARRAARAARARRPRATARDHGAARPLRAASSSASRSRGRSRAGPRLLLADEPTGNLDAAAAASVFELLRELHRERAMTTILVTHNPDLAAPL